MSTTFHEAPPFNDFESFEQPHDPFPSEAALDIRKARFLYDDSGNLRLPLFARDDHSPFVPAAPGTLFYDSALGESATPEGCSTYIDAQGNWCNIAGEANGQRFRLIGRDTGGALFIYDSAIHARLERIHAQSAAPDYIPDDGQQDIQPSATHNISLIGRADGYYWPGEQLVTPPGHEAIYSTDGEVDTPDATPNTEHRRYRGQPAQEETPSMPSQNQEAAEPLLTDRDRRGRQASGEQVVSARTKRGLGRRILESLFGKGPGKRGRSL
ncbi:MAG TPA: hypothetical protein VLG92_05340 [Candidatus Saccharimonadia bacterium]|nr:hypothetical protein [Candidatus Saccharimonadia bacterium]